MTYIEYIGYNYIIITLNSIISMNDVYSISNVSKEEELIFKLEYGL